MKKKLLLILALAVVLCLVFAAVACDPPEDPEQPEQPEQPAAPAEPETPGEPSTPTEPETPAEPEEPSTPSVTPDMDLLEAAKIVFAAEDTYMTSFLSEDNTLPNIELCKMGNDMVVIARDDDGIRQLHYLKYNGEDDIEYYGYERSYGKALFDKTELTGAEALVYYENTAQFAAECKSIVLLAMMTGTDYYGADIIDESNYDEVISLLETIEFYKDENEIWRTPYDNTDLPIGFMVGTDRVSYIGSEIYHSYLSAPDTPANMFAAAYAEIEDRIAQDISSGIALRATLDMLNSDETFVMEIIDGKTGDLERFLSYTLAPEAPLLSTPVECVYIEYADNAISALYHLLSAQDGWQLSKYAKAAGSDLFEKTVYEGDAALEECYFLIEIDGTYCDYGPNMIVYSLAETFPEDVGFDLDAAYSFIDENYTVLADGWFCTENGDLRYNVLDNAAQLYAYPDMIYKWRVPAAQDIPADKFAAAYEEIISQSSITSDMSLKEAVTIAALHNNYLISVETNGETICYGAVNCPEYITLEKVMSGAVADEAVLVGLKNSAGGIDYIYFFLHNGNEYYSCDISSSNRINDIWHAAQYEYEKEELDGEDAINTGYGACTLYAQLLPLLLADTETIPQTQEEWDALYDEIDANYILDPADGWYKTSNANAFCLAYRVENNAIAIQTSSDGVQRLELSSNATNLGPAGIYVLAQVQVQDKIAPNEAISSDMTLEEAVNAAAQVRTYSIKATSPEGKAYGVIKCPEGMTLADVVGGAVADEAVLISRNTEGKITQLTYFKNDNGTYSALVITLNEQTNEYTYEKFTGEDALIHGECTLYAQMLPLLLLNKEGDVVTTPDWDAVYAEINEKYTLSEDGWYRTSEPGLCPAYRIEANAISVQTGSADGQVWQWLFDKASPSSAYGAATNEIYGVIIPPDLLL